MELSALGFRPAEDQELNNMNIWFRLDGSGMKRSGFPESR
jgi:hypothetical protein